MQKENLPDDSVGWRLQYVRKEILGLSSQRFLAEYFGCNKGSVTRYENNSRSIPLNLFYKLYVDYNLSPNWLQLGHGKIYCDGPRGSFSEADDGSIGSRLIFIRKDIASISSQKEFAGVIGASSTSILLYEQDKGEIPTKIFQQLHDLYHISFNWFLFGEKPILLSNS